MQPTRTRTRPDQDARAGIRGFSFIELMAVLAITGILAAAVASTTMSRLKRTAREVEATNMGNIAEALRTYVKLTRTVPAPTDWATLVASQMNASPDHVTTTSAGIPRVFAVDPSAQIGATAGAGLPYQQTATGALEPVNARAFILSSTDGPIPSFALSAATFAQIWNTTDGSIPSVLTNYSGSTDDFRIQRIDLRELFYRVILSNLDPAATASYSIGAIANPSDIVSNDRIERWFIASTPLNLHTTTGSLQARDLLRTDLSYVFENGRWTRYLNYGRQLTDNDFTAMVSQFLNSNPGSAAPGTVTPSTVVQEFYVYLASYAKWSSGSGFVAGTTNAIAPDLRVLRESQQRLDDFTAALLQPQP